MYLQILRQTQKCRDRIQRTVWVIHISPQTRHRTIHPSQFSDSSSHQQASSAPTNIVESPCGLFGKGFLIDLLPIGVGLTDASRRVHDQGNLNPRTVDLVHRLRA